MELTVQGPEARADAAWAAVVEDDRLFRIAGGPPIRVRLREDADGEVVPAGTMLGPAGLRHTFADTELEWVTGHHFRLTRSVTGPLLRSVHFSAELAPGPQGGVVPRLTLAVEPRYSVGTALLRLYLRGVRAGWERELDTLPAPDAPAAVPRPRRPIDLTTRAALTRWTDRGARPALRARIEHWLQNAPRRLLDGVRPARLLAEWADDDALIDDLVEAAASGALTLAWRLTCPRCGHRPPAIEALSGLPESTTCVACNTVYPVDLVDTVEAVVCAPGWLRGVEPSSPSTAASLPDTLAAAIVHPDRPQTLALDLKPGAYPIVSGAGCPEQDGVLHVVSDGPTQASWHPGQGPTTLGTGPTRLTLTGTPVRRHFIRIRRPRPSTPSLPAFVLLTRPRFQRRLGGQAPAPDTALEVSDATVFFTDLTGTSAYFSEHGDRAAVRHIRRRLDRVEAVVRSCGGIRVKTLGDGILALFSRPAKATQAARVLLGSPDRGHPGEPVLRIGIARGPILTEHTDAAGLDCFGATVNEAARAVYEAAPGTAAIARSAATAVDLADQPTDGTLVLTG